MIAKTKAVCCPECKALVLVHDVIQCECGWRVEMVSLCGQTQENAVRGNNGSPRERMGTPLPPEEATTASGKPVSPPREPSANEAARALPWERNTTFAKQYKKELFGGPIGWIQGAWYDLVWQHADPFVRKVVYGFVVSALVFCSFAYGLMELKEYFTKNDFFKPKIEIAKEPEEPGTKDKHKDSNRDSIPPLSPKDNSPVDPPKDHFADGDVEPDTIESDDSTVVVTPQKRIKEDINQIMSLLKQRRLSDAHIHQNQTLKKINEVEYEFEIIKAVNLLVEEYGQFWGCLDKQLVNGMELVFKGGDKRCLIAEASPTLIRIMKDGKIHRYSRTPQNCSVGTVNVVSSTSSTDEVLLLLLGMEHLFSHDPGKCDLLAAAFLLGENECLKADKALNRALSSAMVAGQTERNKQRSKVTIEQVSLLKKLLPSINTSLALTP